MLARGRASVLLAPRPQAARTPSVHPAPPCPRTLCPIPACRQRELELEAAEEEALAQRVEVVVQARVAAAVGGEEVLARVAARLKEERAKLEERVTRQLDMERKMLLERKRREDAERRQAQEQMERIIEENKRKVGDV